MSYNDKILERLDATVDDEFERETFYRSMAISYMWSIYCIFVLGAIFALILPGFYSLLSVLPLFMAVIPETIGSSWMRKRAPYPRLSTQSVGEYVFIGVMTVIMLVSIFWKLSVFAGGSVVIGGIVGAFAGLLSVPFALRELKKRRQQDQKRLNGELGED